MSSDSRVDPAGKGAYIELTSSVRNEEEACGIRNRFTTASLSGGMRISSVSFGSMDQLNGKGEDISYTAEFFKGCLKLAGLVIAVPGLILYVGAERLGRGLHYVSTALEKYQNSSENLRNVRNRPDLCMLYVSKTKSITSKIVQGVLFLNPISAGLRASIGALALLGAGAMRFGLGDENFKAVISEVDGSSVERFISDDSVHASSFKGVASRIAASLDDIKRAYTPESGSPLSSPRNSVDDAGYF